MSQKQGIRFRWLTGRELDAAIWADVYQLISLTFLRRGSMPYFSFDFFVEVSQRMPDNILVVLAEQNRQPTAAAIFYVSDAVLYGRYWGSDSQYNALHFETCYYQGIDFCIANGKKIFEPGTQGEHKISRGFTPVSTWSAHWLARPEFFAAVANYLEAEERHIDRYIEAVILIARTGTRARASRNNSREIAEHYLDKQRRPAGGVSRNRVRIRHTGWTVGSWRRPFAGALVVRLPARNLSLV